jgi:hypothetical protein
MINFATFNDLDSFRQPLNGMMILRSASARTGIKVFLAHSTKDERYLPGVISMLENYVGQVYIDKADSRLPESTNRETAETLRSTISECTRFVLFVTTNSKDSKWVPWELGIADGKKGHQPVALFPAANSKDEKQWAQQEYLGLYSRIVWGRMEGWTEDGWYVLDYLQNTGTPLKKWLTGG